MKKTILFITTLVAIINLSAQIGAFKVTNGSAIQLGYQNYRYLSFGISPTVPNNGAWAIEHWDGGLNFWKPSPSFNAGNYKMFITDGGYVGINMRPMDWFSMTTFTPSAYPWWWRRSTISNFRLQIDGNAISHGWYTWSDLSIKKTD